MPSIDTDGRPYLFRAAQERLRQNESRLQGLLEMGSDLVTLIGQDGVILSESVAVQRMLGYDAPALVGTNFFAAIHEDDEPWLAGACAKVLREGTLGHSPAV